MSPAALDQVPTVAKKRNDRSAKIDHWVLFMVETIVNWRRQTNPEDEKLTVAEYISEMVRSGAAKEYKEASAWMAKQTDRGPTPPPESEPPRKKS